MVTINESDMTFGPYGEDDFFHIEQSQLRKNLEAVKSVEFILLQKVKTKDKILFVEAKQSSPHPENEGDWNTYIKGIQQKFENSLLLWIALNTGRHIEESCPDTHLSLKLNELLIQFVLVVKGHPPEWLDPLKNMLEKVLKPTAVSFNMGAAPILVINDTIAKNKKLIL